MAERLRLELRTRITPSDRLAICSNTIIGPFLVSGGWWEDRTPDKLRVRQRLYRWANHPKPLVVRLCYWQQSPCCRLSTVSYSITLANIREVLILFGRLLLRPLSLWFVVSASVKVIAELGSAMSRHSPILRWMTLGWWTQPFSKISQLMVPQGRFELPKFGF